jgi:hypothetical protein
MTQAARSATFQNGFVFSKTIDLPTDRMNTDKMTTQCVNCDECSDMTLCDDCDLNVVEENFITFSGKTRVIRDVVCYYGLVKHQSELLQLIDEKKKLWGIVRLYNTEPKMVGMLIDGVFEEFEYEW